MLSRRPLRLDLPRFRAAGLHILTRRLPAERYDKQWPLTDALPRGGTGRVRPLPVIDCYNLTTAKLPFVFCVLPSNLRFGS